jgi:Protein of unknown function (DUF1573)
MGIQMLYELKTILIICLLLSVSVTVALTEGLSWNPAHAEITLDRAGEIEIEYRFINTSKESIGIESVRTCCSCLTAHFDSKLYGEGEKGVLKVVFNPVGRIGIQERTIVVKTTRQGFSPDFLRLKINR